MNGLWERGLATSIRSSHWREGRSSESIRAVLRRRQVDILDKCQPSFIAICTAVESYFQIDIILDLLKVLHMMPLQGLLYEALFFKILPMYLFLVIGDQVNYFLNIFEQEGETDSALKRRAEHLR